MSGSGKPSFSISPVAPAIPFDNIPNGLPTSNVQDFINENPTTKDVTPVEFTVLTGYTRVYPNLTISTGLTIEIQDDAELQVP